MQHLKEAGQIEGSVKDIGALCKEAANDVIDEELEYIKESLWKVHEKDVRRAVVRGLPEWYKAKLIGELNE